jgi:hypothetical protein
MISQIGELVWLLSIFAVTACMCCEPLQGDETKSHKVRSTQICCRLREVLDIVCRIGEKNTGGRSDRLAAGICSHLWTPRSNLFEPTDPEFAGRLREVHDAADHVREMDGRGRFNGICCSSLVPSPPDALVQSHSSRWTQNLPLDCSRTMT